MLEILGMGSCETFLWSRFTDQRWALVTGEESVKIHRGENST